MPSLNSSTQASPTIGLDAAGHAPRDRRLFAYEDINGEPLEGRHAVITPYLVDGSALVNPHLVVREEGRPVNGMRQLITGSKPIDDGHYIFKADERSALLESEPDAAPFLRPFVGAPRVPARRRAMDSRSA